MQVFDYAYIQRQMVNLIVVPVNSTFGSKSCQEQQKMQERLQESVIRQGLSGVVVPGWRGYSGRMKFLAPQSLKWLLNDIEWSYVIKSINGRLICS